MWYVFNDPQDYYQNQDGSDNDPDPIWRDATLAPEDLRALNLSQPKLGKDYSEEDLPF